MERVVIWVCGIEHGYPFPYEVGMRAKLFLYFYLFWYNIVSMCMQFISYTLRNIKPDMKIKKKILSLCTAHTFMKHSCPFESKLAMSYDNQPWTSHFAFTVKYFPFRLFLHNHIALKHFELLWKLQMSLTWQTVYNMKSVWYSNLLYYNKFNFGMS